MGTLRNVLKKRLIDRQGDTQKSPNRTRTLPRQIGLVRRIPGDRVGEMGSPKPS